MAALFDGGASYITAPSAFITASPYTMMGWGVVRLTAANLHQHMMTIFGSGNNQYSILGVETDTAQFAIQGSGSQFQANASRTVMQGAWFHAAAVATSDSSRTVYYDGSSTGGSGSSAAPASIDTIRIGWMNTAITPSQWWHGSMRWVSFHNQALSAAEVLEAASGKPPWLIRPGALVSCLPLDRDPTFDMCGRTWTVTGSIVPVRSDDFPAVPGLAYDIQAPWNRRRIHLAAAPYTSVAINPTWTWTGSVSAASVTASFKQGNVVGLISPIGNTTVAGVNGGTTGGIDTTGSTLIVLFVSQTAAVAAATVSDSKSNTWTALTGKSTTVGDGIFYYCANPIVGAGHTFTVAGTGILAELCVSAWKGTDRTSPFDVQNGNVTTGATSLAAGNVMPSANNELVLTGVSSGIGSSSFSVDSGFTKLCGADASVGVNESGWLAYKIQNTINAGIRSRKTLSLVGTQVGSKEMTG